MKHSIIIICLLFLSISVGITDDKKEYPLTPPKKILKKWRIGYLEGGPWKEYQNHLFAIIKSLSEYGWIEKIIIPPQKDIHDTTKIWMWLAANVRSEYLHFGANDYYSNNWDEKNRKKTKKLLFRRLNESRDIDLMIAMGTWAGLDLANNNHSTPTVVGSTSDPLSAGIIKSKDDSGYDHLHARIDPTRYERHIRAFHDVIGFKKLGVPFNDTEIGRSYAAIEHIKKVAKEREFEIIPCNIEQPDAPESITEIINCTKKLAPKIDAYYIHEFQHLTPKNLFKILAVLEEYKIPSFSQNPDLVKYGILISIAQTNYDGICNFFAQTMARIINGAKPRDLSQIYEEPVKISLNAATAIKIGLKPDLYNLLMNTAKEIYDKIE